jgi:integrase
MAGVYFQFRNQQKKAQMLYMGYKFGTSQILYPTGIKLNPFQCNFEKGKISIKNVAFLEGTITKSNLPMVDSKFQFTYDQITTILTHFKTKVNTYAVENKELLTKELLKTYIDSLYLVRNEKLTNFVNNLTHYLNQIIVDSTKNGNEIAEVEFIELAEKYIKTIKPSTCIFENIDNYIKELKEGVRLNEGAIYNYGTVQRYTTTRNLLFDFNESLTFEDIDSKFETDFNSFMAKVRKYRIATMGKHIGTIKTFCSEALNDGVHKNTAFQKFKVLSTLSNTIALDEQEIRKIYDLDFTSNARLDVVRDMFVLGCRTGLRWSDFTDIKPDNIKIGKGGLIIDIIQFKTKKQVVIPVDDLALEILNKYNNELPKPISNQKFNKYLKEIGKMVPELHVKETFVEIVGGETIEVSKHRWDFITSHSGRRSFATNAFEKGIETKLIRAITGHKTDVSFYGYIKTDPTKMAEMFREKNK